MRELILQLACYQIEACDGGSSFQQMNLLKYIAMNDG